MDYSLFGFDEEGDVLVDKILNDNDITAPKRIFSISDMRQDKPDKQDPITKNYDGVESLGGKEFGDLLIRLCE